jgi:prophage regulatory protein
MQRNDERLLRLPRVIDRTGLPRSAIYDAIERGEFPKPVRISVRAVAWVESEIEAWLRRKIDERERGGAQE